jgi:hypothetical protein
MKIALCISGFTRQYKDCFPYFFKNFLDPLTKTNQVDIFIHGWHANPEDYDSIQELYGAKKIHLEAYTADKQASITQENTTDIGKFQHNITGMYYNIFKCNELKKQYSTELNITYDICVHGRLDNFYFKLPVFNVSPNTIYFERCRSSICDHFYYGDSHTMDKVSSIYTNLHTLTRPSHRSKWPGPGAEHLLLYAITKYFNLTAIHNRKNGYHHIIYYMAVKHHKQLLKNS